MLVPAAVMHSEMLACYIQLMPERFCSVYKLSSCVFVLFRLAETKSTVMSTLADDFDTPRAISALMNLVYHGNCQLQPVSTVTV